MTAHQHHFNFVLHTCSNSNVNSTLESKFLRSTQRVNERGEGNRLSLRFQEKHRSFSRDLWKNDLKLTKKSERSHHATGWTWKTLGFWLIVAQNLPNTLLHSNVLLPLHATTHVPLRKHGRYEVKCRWGGLIQSLPHFTATLSWLSKQRRYIW